MNKLHLRFICVLFAFDDYTAFVTLAKKIHKNSNYLLVIRVQAYYNSIRQELSALHSLAPTMRAHCVNHDVSGLLMAGQADSLARQQRLGAAGHDHKP
jgi:hypothetical protein